jgi:hypothetical protein
MNEEDDLRSTILLLSNGDFSADDEMHAKLSCTDVRFDDAVDPITIGDGERAESKSVSLFDELLWVRGSLQKRPVALAPKRNIGHRIITRLGLRETTGVDVGRRKPNRFGLASF